MCLVTAPNRDVLFARNLTPIGNSAIDSCTFINKMCLTVLMHEFLVNFRQSMDNVEWLLAPKPGALQLSITTMLWGAVGGVILVALCWLIYVPFHWNQVSREDKSP